MPNQNTNPKMHTPNLVNNNIDRIYQLFPHCISEKEKSGKYPEQWAFLQ